MRRGGVRREWAKVYARVLEPPLDALACMTEYARTRPHLADQLTASKVIQLVEAGGGAKGRQGKARQGRETQVCPAHHHHRVQVSSG